MAEIRWLTVLPLIRTALAQPANRGVRRLLRELPEWGNFYYNVVVPYFGLSTAGYLEDLKAAVLQTSDYTLRTAASIAFVQIACTTVPEVEQPLFAWLKQQLDAGDRNRRHFSKMACQAADHFPSVAARYHWIAEHIAECESLELARRLALLRNLSQGNVSRLASWLKKAPRAAGLNTRALAKADCNAAELAAFTRAA